MAKASRYNKQPKMKQKDYFASLEKQRSLEYLQYGEPKLLHQLKMQRGGSSVRRSASDISNRSAPPHLSYQNVQHNIYNNNNNNIKVKRSSSDIAFRQQKTKQKQSPLTKVNKRDDKNAYAGSYVQRSHSDSVRLVRYRENNINNSVATTNHARPGSVDITRHHSAGRYDGRRRPASVDLIPRPRSILKKSTSSSDLDSNYEEDLIFDDEYLDYVSPRDILSNNTNPSRGDQRLNFSFEDEVSRSHVTHSRPISPKTVKRVNFKNELQYYRGAQQPPPPQIRNPMNGRGTDSYSNHNPVQNRIRLKGDQPQQRLEQQYSQQHREETQSLQSFPGDHQSYNGTAAMPNDRQVQPYEIRKPLFSDNNVVDFGTFITKKLSKLKFKSRKKDSSSSISKEKYLNPPGFETQKNGVRTSHDGNFTMLSKSARSPRRKEDFMTEEILY